MPVSTPHVLPDDARRVVAVLLALATLSCGGGAGDAAAARGEGSAANGQRAIACERETGLRLPDGFCATIFADSLGPLGHAAVRADDGTLFVVRRAGRTGEGGVLALRDTTGDGEADVRVIVAPAVRGTGLVLHEDRLYVDAGGAIVRFRIPRDSLRPAGPPDTIVRELPRGGHDAVTFALDGDGGLFVNIGSATNACQREDRRAGSAGLDPCPELETRAGIWRFDADGRGQRPRDGIRWATGIRNATAIAVDGRGQLWAAQHGRDQLHDLWGDYYSAEYSAENPAEELLLVQRGDDFGWPYCYFSREFGRKVLAPEYGGTGRGEMGRCREAKSAAAIFPGHWAPMSLLFHDGTGLPSHYRGGVFIAFHGSWNRSPLPQAGHHVVFLPLRNGEPRGEYEVFADGFAGRDTVLRASDAAYRPVGLAQGPDGALYVTDDRRGRIWRISYRGDR